MVDSALTPLHQWWLGQKWKCVAWCWWSSNLGHFWNTVLNGIQLSIESNLTLEAITILSLIHWLWNPLTLFLLAFIFSLNFPLLLTDLFPLFSTNAYFPLLSLSQRSLGRSFAWGEALHKPLWRLCLRRMMLKALHLQADTKVVWKRAAFSLHYRQSFAWEDWLTGRRTTKPVCRQVFRVSPLVVIVGFFSLLSLRDTGCSRPQGAALCTLLPPLLSSPVCHQWARTLWRTCLQCGCRECLGTYCTCLLAYPRWDSVWVFPHLTREEWKCQRTDVF